MGCYPVTFALRIQGPTFLVPWSHLPLLQTVLPLLILIHCRALCVCVGGGRRTEGLRLLSSKDESPFLLHPGPVMRQDFHSSWSTLGKPWL